MRVLRVTVPDHSRLAHGNTVAFMSAFVPGGQAGQESQRLTREAQMKAVQRRDIHDAEPPKRSSVIKRVLRKLRRAR
jgi:hypothetical protein